MIAILFRLAVAAALALAVSACAGPAQTRGPALWRLADQDSEVWLFGTVHVLPKDLQWRTARVDGAFAAADTIVFETQIDAEAQPRIAALMQRHGAATDGVRLSDRLGQEDRARFARVCAQLKIRCAGLEGLRPWFAANALSVALVVSQGQSAAAGVEPILDAEAVANHKQRRYFETAEQQVRFFADLPPRVELQFFTVTLRQIEEESDMVGALDAAWVKGDVKALERDLNALLREAGPDVYAVLIKDRNIAWANEVDTMMRGSGKVFIAVGAAHLVGKDGLPALLRAKGYRVEGP